MKDLARLSSNDRIIMDLVWEKGEASTASLLKILDGKDSWTRHTVKTYLIRLCEKGLLKRIDLSPRKVKFTPIITKEQYLAGDANSYLHSNFKGLTHMIAGLVDNDMVSDDDLDDLEKFIHEIKQGK